MIPLIAAAHLAFLPMTAPAALAALQAKGPMRIEAYYEALQPLLVRRSKTASATLVADIGPGAYAVRATAKAEGIRGWFGGFSIDAQSNGSVTVTGAVPRRYEITNTDGRANRHLLVDYLPAEVRVLAQPAYGDFGHPAATAAQRLEGMDLLSAVVNLSLGSGSTAENPCGAPIRIFDGKQRYDLQLTFAGKLSYRSAGYKGPALKCAARYVEIAGFRAKDDKQRAKETGDIVWANIILADLPGGLHPPIKIEARTQQKGKLTLQAVKLVYGPAPPSTTVAKR